jgi:transposase
MKKVAEMLANRFEGVLNYLKHRITNAASEGINSLVARVVANARGLRSFASFRVRVLFFLGKLDLSIA